MKKFIVAVFIIMVFLGCGDGGGSSSPEPVLAEATTANAFKAYNALSVSTYLPSFIAKLRPVIANNGVDDTFTCNVSGSIDVSYEYPNASKGVTPAYGANLDDIIGTYRFNKCTLDINGNDIYLDGILNNINFSNDVFESLIAVVVDGFIFRQKNPNEETDITYLKPDEGSAYISSMQYVGHGLEYICNTKFRENRLGDIGAYSVKVGDNRDGFYTNIVKGIYYETGKFVFDGMYFIGSSLPDRSRFVFKGIDDKTVEVWQDDSETVFAQTENTYETSFTSYTPSF